jgi:hypothetical protein
VVGLEELSVDEFVDEKFVVIVGHANEREFYLFCYPLVHRVRGRLGVRALVEGPCRETA